MPRTRRSLVDPRPAAAWLAIAALCAGASARGGEAWGNLLTWNGASTRVTIGALSGERRRYTFEHVDGDGQTRNRVIEESEPGSFLRTDSALFDGLYALALTEAAEDSVDEIRDGQFNDGKPIPCRCFETGLKWPYVWTRDISYSVDLALALMDPERARASLFFKQSAMRPELVAAGLADAQVVAQDTGSGGSWPISTDRVVWIHAATDVVDALGPRGSVVEPEVLRVARDTLAQDRRYAYDARAGLYRGETSFLDWREQTYPAWTIADTRFIAEGFSLSTNVLHYVALRDAARLARHLHAADAPRFEAEASVLKAAINSRFWVAGRGLYASYLSRDLSPAYAFDLLGIALAIEHGIADPPRARQMLSGYPVTLAGPPVIWPEQPGIAIYHNRAMWPFVTAYALRAAMTARDSAHASAFAESIVRGAAMSLSNYENHEFLTQSTAFADGPLSGPVINSPRQLWSVAAYAGMVVHDLFGVHIGSGGAITVAPSLPGGVAQRLAGPGQSIRLQNLSVAGHRVDLDLQLPERWSRLDTLEAGALMGDGLPLVVGHAIPADVRHVTVRLRVVTGPGNTVQVKAVRDASHLSDDEHRELFAPASPVLQALVQGGAKLSFSASGVDAGNDWQLYRDGVEVASGVAGRSLEVAAEPARAHCFVATQAWPAAGHRSLPSRELCIYDAAHQYEAGGKLVSPDGHPAELVNGLATLRDWGAPGERLEFTDVAARDGLQRLTLAYSNGYGPVNTGVTAAVKEVTALCPSMTGPQRGAIVMPHLASAGIVDISTAFAFRAKRGESCRIVIADGINMSYLAHFALYTAARGGRTGAWNRAGIYRATVVPVTDDTQPIARPRATRAR